MEPGLGTHFNGWVSRDELAAMATRFCWARIDAQTSGRLSTLEWMRDARSVGMQPIVIVYDLERLRGLPDGSVVEWGNEVDIKLGNRPRVRPADYRKSALEAFAVARAKGMTFYAGAIANLNRNGWFAPTKGIAYLEELRMAEWDPEIRCCVHHYTNGVFGTAHSPYKTREGEVRALESAIGPTRLWAVTEFGYQQGARTDEDIAAQVGQEWAFWQKYPNCQIAAQYQIRDGLPGTGESYGLLRFDGTIKTAIFETLPPRAQPQPPSPPPTEDDDMPRAEYVISRSESFEISGKPGCFATYYPRGQRDTVLSVQPDGSLQTRPAASPGAWETWRPETNGTRAHFVEAQEHFALPLVD